MDIRHFQTQLEIPVCQCLKPQTGWNKWKHLMQSLLWGHDWHIIQDMSHVLGILHHKELSSFTLFLFLCFNKYPYVSCYLDLMSSTPTWLPCYLVPHVPVPVALMSIILMFLMNNWLHRNAWDHFCLLLVGGRETLSIFSIGLDLFNVLFCMHDYAVTVIFQLKFLSIWSIVMH